MIILKKDMVFSIKIKGIKYFLRSNEDEVEYIVEDTSIICGELLKKIGLDTKIIGYFIFNGKPVSLSDKIMKEGILQIVPFLSGG